MADGVRVLYAARRAPGERDRLAAVLGARLGVPARVTAEALDVERAYDASRRQYNASALMAQVTELARRAGEKCIAVVDVDLFIPVLTFVFGQAALRGDAGVVSTHRLANEFYGMPGNEALLRQRVEKEILQIDRATLYNKIEKYGLRKP